MNKINVLGGFRGGFAGGPRRQKSQANFLCTLNGARRWNGIELLALPSSRVSLGWAQDVLFPDAEAGKRIVICMRSAAYWSLEPGRKYKGTLFAPMVNRSGHMLKNDENRRLVDVVQNRLGN